VRYAGKQESFADLESALMQQFSTQLEAELRRMNDEAARAYAQSIRTGDGDAMRALQAAQRAVITTRPEIAAQIAEVGREYTRLIVNAGFEAGAQGFFEVSGEPSRSVIAATARASQAETGVGSHSPRATERKHMLTKESTVSLISIAPSGAIEVQRQIIVKDGDTEVARAGDRTMIYPGDDYSSEDARVQAVCHAIHTPEIVSTYQARLAAANQQV